MSSPRTAKFSLNGVQKNVALFDGLQADELNRLLQAVFSIPSGSNVVGFLGEVHYIIFSVIINLFIIIILISYT